MSQQQSCHDMSKIVTWDNDIFSNKSNIFFPNLDYELINPMWDGSLMYLISNGIVVWQGVAINIGRNCLEMGTTWPQKRQARDGPCKLAQLPTDWVSMDLISVYTMFDVDLIISIITWIYICMYIYINDFIYNLVLDFVSIASMTAIRWIPWSNIYKSLIIATDEPFKFGKEWIIIFIPHFTGNVATHICLDHS